LIMRKIDIKLIEDVEKRIDALSDKELERAVSALEKKQPYLYAFAEATQEIFEDEEEFVEDAVYLLFLIDEVFKASENTTGVIPPELIEKADAAHIEFIGEISGRDDFEDVLLDTFGKHQAADFLFYIFDNLFDEQTDYDDHGIETATQLMLFAYFIIDVYSKEVK